VGEESFGKQAQCAHSKGKQPKEKSVSSELIKDDKEIEWSIDGAEKDCLIDAADLYRRATHF
jgi:hypothetical protein